MLSPADRDLAARDPALPGLGRLLDGRWLADCLGLETITEPYLRYKPNTKCVLAFRAGKDDAALMAMAYPPDRYNILRDRRSLQEAGEVVRFFDDLCLAVMPARFDRDLRSLSKLTDPRQLAPLLAKVLGPLAEGARLRLLRHNPNRRAVLRLDAPDGRPLALGKIHAKGEWARIRENARLAEARGGARVLGVAEDSRLIFHEWIAGRPLWSEDEGSAGTAALKATGAALARLHRADPGNARAITAPGESEELAASAQALARLLPSLGPRAMALAGTVAARLGDHDRATALVHGDFSADQVVMGEDGPVLIDWDRAAIGDPARDLGSFLARLDVQAIDGDLSVAEAACARQALLSGYAAEAALPLGLDAQHARALLALLPEGFRQRRADWPERATGILDRAEALLPVSHLATDPMAGLLGPARDLKRAASAVAAAAALPANAVVGVALLRRKPGRRALLRYALDGAPPAALLGKLRAKGTDLRTPRLHAALRAAGLDGRAPHRVGVPRPCGVVEGMHLWLQEEVAGTRVTQHLRPGGDTLAAAGAGAALARLHATRVETTRHWGLADELTGLEQSLGQAAAQLPSEARRLSTLFGGCKVVAGSLPAGPATGIHRDWYPDQVLIDGDVMWILDLDLYAYGDPAVDLGNFLAHVTDLAIRRHGAPGALVAHEAAFLGGYTAAGGRCQAFRVAALKALSLARLVAVSLRIPDRRAAAGPILRAAEEELSTSAMS